MSHNRALALVFSIIGSLLIGSVSFGEQKPIKCKHENKERAPDYRVGWRHYSVEGPKTLFIAVSIGSRHFSNDKMVALAHRLKQDFCHEKRLFVAILDDYKAARAFSSTNEKQWFHNHWRGQYLLDRDSGKEEIGFSTASDKPRDEVKISLSPGNQDQEH